jgi:hypothetical protein
MWLKLKKEKNISGAPVGLAKTSPFVTAHTNPQGFPVFPILLINLKRFIFVAVSIALKSHSVTALTLLYKQKN